MKTTLLLPNGFKKIGWAIFVPAFLLGCSICFFGEISTAGFSAKR